MNHGPKTWNELSNIAAPLPGSLQAEAVASLYSKIGKAGRGTRVLRHGLGLEKAALNWKTSLMFFCAEQLMIWIYIYIYIHMDSLGCTFQFRCIPLAMFGQWPCQPAKARTC